MDYQAFVPMAEKAVTFFLVAMAELTVLFIGISFLVALIQHYLSHDRVKTMLSSSRGRGYLMGAGLGALTPFCSCSTIPITAGLLKARAGFGPTMSFLFASPLVNPVLATLFFATFGWQVTLVYSLLALGLASLSGWMLHRFGFSRHIRHDVLDTPEPEAGPTSGEISIPASPPQPVTTIQPMMLASAATPAAASGCCSSVSKKKPKTWQLLLGEAVGQFKSFLPYVVIGVAIGAVCHGFVPDNFVLTYAGPDNPLAVPVAAVIGVPLYVRASTMVPIGMSLMAKGMSLGAVMALIIGGAGASLPEMIMLKRMFKLPVLAAFLLTVFGMAVSAGFIVNLWF
jgi:uncharacterized membrane protein YraQ (UPF0718 family)